MSSAYAIRKKFAKQHTRMKTFRHRPHVIVIGAQKAGTTWLQHALSCSHEVWYPEGQGEIQFFNRDYNLGLDHYLRLYEAAPTHLTTADVTPDYLDCKDTPGRIQKATPSINRPLRFVLICREPVSRLLSAYQMKVRYGFEGTLDEALATDSWLIKGATGHIYSGGWCTSTMNSS